MTTDDFKTCGRCGNKVAKEALPGDRCPHCGVLWGVERPSSPPPPPASSDPKNKPPKPS